MIDQIKEELQKKMSIRYDAEFAQILDFIQKAYNKGYEDGKDTTKMQIINMLTGETNETTNAK